MPAKLTLKAKATKLWKEFTTVIDWLDQNTRYFKWVGRIAFNRWTLGLAAAFGVTAPNTAENLKHDLLGERAAQVEVGDQVLGTPENPDHVPE